mgnify:CR=1 FL=1
MSINNISNLMNSRLRLTGFSSGLDTDSIISKLMEIEKTKIYKVQRAKQLLEWKRDGYRDITSKLRSLSDEYFNVLKPATNFRSSSSFASFNVTSGNESVVTAKANADAISKTHSIQVSALATSAKIVGVSGLAESVKGSNTISSLNLEGKQLDFTLDGVTKTINLHNYSSVADLETNIETALAGAFGSGKIDVLTTGNQIEFKMLIDGSTLSVKDSANNFIGAIGYSAGQKNYIEGSNVNTNYSAYTNGSFKLTLGNGTAQNINITDASDINDLTSKIQSAIDANAELNGKIKVTNDGSKLSFQTTSGDAVKLNSGETNNVLDKLGFANGATVTGTSSNIIDLSGNEQGKSFTINVNGVDKTIQIDKDYSDLNELAAYINTQIGGTVNVAKDSESNRLVFSTSGNDKIIFNKGPEDGLQKLGFSATDNKSSAISLNSSLDSIKTNFKNELNVTDPNANVTFTINGQTIDVGKTYANATLSDVMNAINSSNAGVKMTYDSLTQKFSLEAKTQGATSTITLTDSSTGLLKSMGVIDGTYTQGTDAEFTLDGVSGMKRSSNEFTIDGVTYSLKGLSSEAVNVNVEGNIDAVINNIKGFVSKYNELLDTINGKLSEKKDRNYTPLIDDEKDAMKEDEVKKWEEKAKLGILNNDSILSNIVNNMRRALYDKVEGVDLSLFDIGISTGLYQEKGKLVIDETKLKDALTNNYNEVVKLFTNESQYSYTQSLDDAGKRATRYNESGLAQRLFDTIQDNIRTTRNSNGQKGILLEKAGYIGDGSEYSNLIAKEIQTKNTLIDTLIDKMMDKEDWYYSRFSIMESALSDMQSQSSWLGNQFNM